MLFDYVALFGDLPLRLGGIPSSQPSYHERHPDRSIEPILVEQVVADR